MSHAKKLPSATLNGSGSTFQLAFDQAAIQEFTTLQPDITINYSGGGSGKGRQDFADSVVQFAGTDAPYPPATAPSALDRSEEHLLLHPDDRRAHHGLVQPERREQAPALRERRSPRSSPVRSRRGTTRRSPRTTRGQAAEHRDHGGPRSDSSGTTQNFTTFLTKAAPPDWTLGAASTINWPADTQGGTGNAGSPRSSSRRTARSATSTTPTPRRRG